MEVNLEVLVGLTIGFYLTLKLTLNIRNKNMFNRTTNITNYNFFGQMSVEEMVQAVKGLNCYDQITLKYPKTTKTPDQHPAVEKQEGEQDS